MSINLFIPAAGYGERLRPLTEVAPKPLLPIVGIPLIQRVIESIMKVVEIKNIGINTHYLPEVVEAWSNESVFKEKIELFFEPKILGTGGALKNAAKLLGQGTFIVANGDVLTDLDWAELLHQHRRQNNLVTLAVQDREHERRIGTDKNHRLKIIDVEEKCDAPGIDHWFGYACAAVYEAEFLNYLPEGESHVVPYWLDAAGDSGRVGVHDIGANTYWLDLGTPQSFVQAVKDSLMGEKRFFRQPLQIPYDCELEGDVIVENDVQIGSQVKLENCILLPGSKIADGSHLHNCVCGPHFCLPVQWPCENTARVSLNKIGSGGSDRIYTRHKNGITLHYSAFEQNIPRQIEMTRALIQSGVNVPGIHSHDPLQRQMHIQDLGDITFQDWLKDKNRTEQAMMLEKILDQLWKFQFTDPELCPAVKEKIFDQKVLRWETDYFTERFVRRVCNRKLDKSHLQLLENEFEQLANAVDAMPKAVMHRDFQSTNVMIKDEQAWFIDFQGAHWGTPFFDVVSICRDPYVEYKCDISKIELDYALRLCEKLQLSKELASEWLNLCALQRHMQALGAYGFITHIRGKNFLKWCKPALAHLKNEIGKVKDRFPALNELIFNLEPEL